MKYTQVLAPGHGNKYKQTEVGMVAIDALLALLLLIFCSFYNLTRFPFTCQTRLPKNERFARTIRKKWLSQGGPFWRPFWSHFWSDFGAPARSILGSILGRFWGRFWTDFGTIWKHFGCYVSVGLEVVADSVRIDFRTILGSILDRFWNHFGTFWMLC